MRRDDVIKMAQVIGWDFGWEMTVQQVCEFAASVAAAEREQCALVCEQAGIDGYGTLAAAALIRARSPQ